MRRVILGSDFIDEFVQRTDVITQQLVLVDGAWFPLMRTVRTDLHSLLAQPTRLEGRSGRPSQKGRAAVRTTLKLGTQTWVIVTAPTSVVTLIQSKPELYLKRRATG